MMYFAICISPNAVQTDALRCSGTVIETVLSYVQRKKNVLQ